MAGSALADAISRLRMHRAAMEDLAAKLAAEKDARGPDPAPQPDHDQEEQGP